jgi:hypothetical protein
MAFVCQIFIGYLDFVMYLDEIPQKHERCV